MGFGITLLLAIAAAGCGSDSKDQSGDFGAFVVQEVTRFGGRTCGTNTTHELAAEWTVKADAAGFRATASRVRFAELQAALQAAFGPPTFVTTNVQGQPHGLYKAADLGVALQFFGEPSGVGVIGVRGVKL